MSTTRRAEAAPQPGPPDGEAERDAIGAGDATEDAAQALIDHHIVPGPGDRGAHDARLGESGTPVWALVGAFFSHALADPGRVAAAYEVSEEAVRAALLFYRRHQAAIDGWLALNDA
jgi:hypothetical protein